MSSYILNLSCPDRTGIVHAVSGFLLERGGNIEEAAQYNDRDTGLFFMRVAFASVGAVVGARCYSGASFPARPLGA